MPINKQDYDKIQLEMEGAIETLKKDGFEGEALRTKIIEMVDHSVQYGFRANFFEILMSPDAGIRYAYASHEAIGAINGVIDKIELAPIHIKELPQANAGIVHMIESYFGKTIDEVFKDIEKGENN